MAHFPMFVDLTGKTVLILGGGKHAEEKIEKMWLFDCHLRCIPTEAFTQEALDGIAMAILCDRHHPRNESIVALCRSRHIPVNAVDDPPLCDFQFPALIRRGHLTVAFSTDGKTPAVGRLLREELEQHLPDRTEEILLWSSELTMELRRSIPDYHRRAELLNRILRRAFKLGRPLTEEEMQGWFTTTADGDVFSESFPDDD